MTVTLENLVYLLIGITLVNVFMIFYLDRKIGSLYEEIAVHKSAITILASEFKELTNVTKQSVDQSRSKE